MTMPTGDRVLVTGLSGFIAKHMAFRLLGEGYRVRGTVRSRIKGEEAKRTLARAGADVSRLELVEADLLQDGGWADAAQDCRFVQHTASPFPSRPPRDRFALVPAAREGTLRVLHAAIANRVERTVLTSSVVAIYHGHPPGRREPFTEVDFTNVDAPTVSAYPVSKTLAEQAAWAAVEGSGLQLAVINPSLVLGPLMDADAGTSLRLLQAMMKGWMPVVPDARFGVVDVRDVAQAHVAAMVLPEAAGRRFIASGETASLLDLGSELRALYPSLRRLPRHVLPDEVLRFAARVATPAAQLRAEIDPHRLLDVSAARHTLGIRFRGLRETVGSAAESLVEHGLVRPRA